MTLKQPLFMLTVAALALGAVAAGTARTRPLHREMRGPQKQRGG